MTTNVYDKDKSLLTTDSRWSYRPLSDGVPSTQVVAYVDDTGFDKIAFDDVAVFMFAGPGDLIDRWKTFVSSPNKVLLRRPDVARTFAICMILKSSGEIVMEHGQKIKGSGFRFAGTGAEPAYECWSSNKDPKKAVKSATTKDPLSGGTVKFFQSQDGTHNLDTGVAFSSVAEQFLAKGQVMYTAQNAIVPVAQAAQQDPRIAALVAKVQKGGVSAEAPSGYDPVVWTPEDEQRLDDALSKLYGVTK